MATITLGGNPCRTSGELPAVGSAAPNGEATNASLEIVSLDDFAGKKKILSFVPSLDTGVCATQARSFHERVSGRGDTALLVISADTPFAAKRFCTTEGLENVVTLSTLRGNDLPKAYGVLITDGPFAGLCARAVVTLDESDTVVHTELVPEIGQEPDYEAAIAALGTA